MREENTTKTSSKSFSVCDWFIFWHFEFFNSLCKRSQPTRPSKCRDILLLFVGIYTLTTAYIKFNFSVIHTFSRSFLPLNFRNDFLAKFLFFLSFAFLAPPQPPFIPYMFLRRSQLNRLIISNTCSMNSFRIICRQCSFPHSFISFCSLTVSFVNTSRFIVWLRLNLFNEWSNVALFDYQFFFPFKLAFVKNNKINQILFISLFGPIQLKMSDCSIWFLWLWLSTEKKSKYLIAKVFTSTYCVPLNTDRKRDAFTQLWLIIIFEIWFFHYENRNSAEEKGRERMKFPKRIQIKLGTRSAKFCRQKVLFMNLSYYFICLQHIQNLWCERVFPFFGEKLCATQANNWQMLADLFMERIRTSHIVDSL